MLDEQTKQAMREFQEKVMTEMADKVGYLYDRWQDEKEYEDFADYKAEACRFCNEKGYKYMKLSKRPFTLTLRFNDAIIMDLVVTARQIKTVWKKG